ncbi:MAG: High frequency lysogenization protein HflD [Gammaproteobacteria bacterium]|nr:High frequency lysogenization protein HflD [Gammaproteobacteria bacterium]
MSDANERDKILALAGLYQGAALARQLARRGYADEAPLRASVRSVLITDAVNTVSIFGGIEGVRLGLLSISRQSGSAGDLEVARYVVALCRLAKRFYCSPELVNRVSQELAAIQEDVSVDAGGDITTETYERFADLYKANLSRLKPGIIVQGEQDHLKNTHVVAQIRTSLLAGIRSGVLFSQLGGSRWQLVLQRCRYMDNATRLLEEIDGAPQSETVH